MVPHSNRKHPRVIDLTKEEGDKKPAALPGSPTSTATLVDLSSDRDARKDTGKEEPPRKRVARAKTDKEDFTCPICLSDDVQDVKNQTYSLTTCGHSFCFTCLENLVQASTGDASTAKSIPCPMTTNGCTSTLKWGTCLGRPRHNALNEVSKKIPELVARKRSVVE